MNLINVTIKKRLTGEINTSQAWVSRGLREATDRHTADLTRQIRDEYFRSSYGTYSAKSELAKSIKVLPAEIVGEHVIGGISIGEGLPYTDNFVTDESTVTIKPTKKKNLAVPLSKQADDLQRAASGGLRRGGLVLYRRGNLLFREYPGPERTKSTRGRKPKVPYGGKSPYFILMKSVAIRPKIHPSDIVAENLHTYTNRIRREVYTRFR